MSSRIRVESALEQLRKAAVSQVNRRSDLFDAYRDLVQSKGDELDRAEYAILESTTNDRPRPIDEVVTDLRRAVRVCQLNGRRKLEATAWSLLSTWTQARGDTVQALLCAERALSFDELPLGTRLALMIPVVVGRTLVFDPAGAWDTCRRQLEPYLDDAQPGDELALAYVSIAMLNLEQAYREANLLVLSTLDLPDGRSEVPRPLPADCIKSLGQVERFLDRARATERGRAGPYVNSVQAMLLGMRGEVDAALALADAWPGAGMHECIRLQRKAWMLRVNGRHEQALPMAARAVETATELGVHHVRRAANLDLALSYARCGDAQRSNQALSVVLQMTARMLARLRSGRPAEEVVAPAEPERADSDLAAAATVGRQVRALPPYLQRVTVMLASGAGPRMSVGDAASKVGVKPRTLQAACREYWGCSFLEARRRATMARASELLRLTDEPVQRLAQSLGYSTLQAFGRDFRRVYHLSPAHYRARARLVGEPSDATR